MPAGSGGEVYRTRLTWWAGWGLMAFYLVLAAGEVISIATDHPPGSEERWIPAICVFVVLGILACLFWTRAATAAIFTDEDGIRIRNLLVTDRFLWEDIDRFELRPMRPYPAVCAVILRNGAAVRAVGIQAAYGWVRSDTPQAEELVDDLNAELRRARLRG
jgi:hypothetical protein